jgi:hypothetical protein
MKGILVPVYGEHVAEKAAAGDAQGIEAEIPQTFPQGTSRN